MGWRKLAFVATGSVALCCGAASLVGAQPTQAYIADILQQIREFEAVFRQRGYPRTHRMAVKQQDKRSVEKFTVNFDSGKTYFVVAVCDRDCDDVDIQVRDASGHVIAEDTGKDDKPIVQIDPDYDGPHEVRVAIPGCSAARYCHIGVAVFGQ